MTLKDEWVTNNYENILQWAKNAAQGKPDYEDLAHYAITIFLEHPKAEELVKRNEARWFIVRILLNSSRGAKSEYYRLYRPKHDLLPDHYTDLQDEEYDHDIDLLTENIRGILDDLQHGDVEQWYMATIFELCIKQPKLNFSKIARETGIPRTSISHAYYQTVEYVKQQLIKYGFNLNDFGPSLIWGDDATDRLV
jgi:hypothetical protein